MQKIKVGNIVKFKGDFDYRASHNFFYVMETFSNDRGNGDDVALISFKEPQTGVIRAYFNATACLEVVKTELEKKA